METATPDDFAAFGDWERRSWERRAVAYARSLGVLTHGSIEALLDAAGVTTGTRVLDVGTGPGFVALAAARRGARVQAVDQAEQMVTIARDAGVDVEVADVEHLPLADGTVEAVVVSYVLNHLPRPQNAVTEFHRVLCDAGRLAMTIWDVPSANAVTGLVAEVVAERGLAADVPSGLDPCRYADPAAARELLHGWNDLAVTSLRWTITVEPGAWFDALAAATPRTGAALAQASPEARAGARQRYVELARERFPAAGDEVALPAAAVLITARR